MAKQHRTTTPIPTQPKASRLRSQPRVSTSPRQSGKANPYHEHKLLRLERFLRSEFGMHPGSAECLLHLITTPLLAYTYDPLLFKALPDEEILRIGFSTETAERHSEWLKLNKIPIEKWPAELIQYQKAESAYLRHGEPKDLQDRKYGELVDAMVEAHRRYYEARNGSLAELRKRDTQGDTAFKIHHGIKPVTGRKREKTLREFGAAAVEMSRSSKRGDDYGLLTLESRPFDQAYQKAFQAFIKLTGTPDHDDDTNKLYAAEMEPIIEMFNIAVESAIEAARPHKAA
jgi:hypothetical protein